MSGLKKRQGGQALVEFALIILVLLFIIFVLIESSRLLQANLTVQNAARAATRYAMTGKYETDCLADAPPCDDPRVESIKAVAADNLAGLVLDPNADLVQREPNAYRIQVLTPNEDYDPSDPASEAWITGAGGSGDPVMVRVYYEVPLITPLVRPIAEVIRVNGQAVVNNAEYEQISFVGNDTSPPELPPPPPPPAPPPPPDVLLTKNAPGAALVDSEFNYTLFVRNTSVETDATSVEVTDNLPGEVTYVSDDSGCNHSGGTVSCNLGTLGPDEERTIVITVRAPNFETNVHNVAQVSLAEADPVPDNNDDTADTSIETEPSEVDLEVTKTGPPTVQGGEDFAYTIVVANDALIPATAVEVSDDFPSELTFNGATPNICNQNGQTLTCNVGNLDPLTDQTITLNVSARMIPATVTNRATVGAEESDSNPGNNVSEATTEILVLPDLAVTLTDMPDPVLVGENLTYNITVVNNGNGDATNVVVDNLLPGSVNFVSASPSSGSCQHGGNVVTCNVGGLVTGASTSITIVVAPTEEGNIVETSSASSAEGDANNADNVASVSTTVQMEADLRITKSGPATAEEGVAINYQIAVYNDGPSPATGVVVEDQLPPEMSFISATPSQGSCSTVAPVVCQLGRMDADGSATIVIRAMPIAAGNNVVNTAVVRGGQTDPNTGNNTASTGTDVTGGNHFITVSPQCGEAGDTFTVNGYNWSNQRVTLYFDGRDTGQTVRPDRNGDWSMTYTLPSPLADGAYDVRAEDSQGRTATATFTIPCPAPNLVITDMTLVNAGQTITTGTPLTVTVDIENIGNQDAVSQFFVGLYVDPSPAPTATSTHLSSADRVQAIAVGGLATGATKSVTFVLSDGLDGGIHDLYAVVDSDPGPTGIIPERWEDDNIAGPITVDVEWPPGGPPPTPTPEPVPTPEGYGQLSGLVRNQNGNPQFNVEIFVEDQSSGALFGPEFSDTEGIYRFLNLPVATYTVTACIMVDENGTLNYYGAIIPGVVINANQVTVQNIFLEPMPEGCGS